MAPVAQDPSSQARAEWIAAKIGDKPLRGAWIRAVADKSLKYSDAERKQIKEGLDMEAEVNGASVLKAIKVSTPLLDKAVAVTSKDGQHNIVQSSATVRAPLMDVLSFMFCLGQEVNKIVAGESGTSAALLESKNEHCLVMQYRIQLPRPFSHRDMVLCAVYKELESGDHALSITSTEHAAATKRGNAIRFTGTRLLRFSQVTPTVTRFTATATFDLGGHIPRFISDTITTPAASRAPLYTLGYFLQIKETAEFDAAGQDARALGQLLVHEMEPVRNNNKLLEARLHVFLFRTTVLRELTDARPWFEALLHQVLLNEAQIKNKLVSGVEGFTPEDGRATGAKLALLLLKKQPQTAVDVMRLFSGAGLSVFDLVSDVYMIVVFLGSEETRGVAHVNIACVALSLLFQLAIVWIVNRKRSWRRLAKEVLYVVLFIKPGIDAARVAAGNENDDGLATMDPLQELAGGKMVEMIFESIPAAIIQTRAFIISKERSTLALVSIMISCFTTGFAAATMWYDFDTSPEKRKECPRLAGAAPDTGRGPFFFLIVVSGALQVVAKSFSSALLFIASPNYFLSYMAGDHFMYQLYRIARCDYIMFLPGFNVPLSFWWRFGEKLVADFTSCWLFRSPITIHGCYFLFNQLATFASVFASVHLYISMGNDHLPARLLWISAGSISAAWALAYLSLVLMVKPEWRSSFWSTRTTLDEARTTFFDGATDEEKMGIFGLHETKWRRFRGEVREWTHANWAGWKGGGGEWFTPELVSRVPDEFIPVGELVELNKAARGGKRRRSVSVVQSLRVSAREPAN
ncbi:hypothetical protein TeGR_g1263 [Tetraparma gracilis]|uniref:Uncharacterized protein n=1 Tax=Tetraparma gracilis TaxID=2962635 RepID=A0ABQ6MLH1_9STRA|nr:hypothetical protein TeGR_g1263 [Tetraparma gracilis]